MRTVGPSGDGRQPGGEGGGFLRGLWGAGSHGSAAQPSAAPSAEAVRADLTHAEVEYVLSVAEARQYSPAELADAVVPPPTLGSSSVDGDVATLPTRPAAIVIAIETSEAAYESGAVKAYCEAAIAALRDVAAEAAAEGASVKVALLTYNRNVEAFLFRSNGCRRSAIGQRRRARHGLLLVVLDVVLDVVLRTAVSPRHMPPALAELADVLPELEALLTSLADA